MSNTVINYAFGKIYKQLKNKETLCRGNKDGRVKVWIYSIDHKENEPTVFSKVVGHTPLNGGWSEGTARSGNAHAEQI